MACAKRRYTPIQSPSMVSFRRITNEIYTLCMCHVAYHVAFSTKGYFTIRQTTQTVRAHSQTYTGIRRTDNIIIIYTVIPSFAKSTHNIAHTNATYSHSVSGQGAAYASGPTLRDRRDDEQRGSPYDAKCNVEEIGVVNMGEIGAVRKRSR